MKRYFEGENRSQSTLFPESLDDYIAEDNPVRVIDVFVDELELKEIAAYPLNEQRQVVRRDFLVGEYALKRSDWGLPLIRLHVPQRTMSDAP